MSEFSHCVYCDVKQDIFYTHLGGSWILAQFYDVFYEPLSLFVECGMEILFRQKMPINFNDSKRFLNSHCTHAKDTFFVFH